MKRIIVSVVALLAIISIASTVNMVNVKAEHTITLKFHKDFGYSGFGNDVQGDWTARAIVSEDTTHVEFYLDNLLQFNDTTAPFSWSYNTDDYIQGLHTIKAVAYNADGGQAAVEAQQEFIEFSLNFIMYIMAAVVASIVVVFIILLVKVKRN